MPHTSPAPTIHGILTSSVWEEHMGSIVGFSLLALFLVGAGAVLLWASIKHSGTEVGTCRFTGCFSAAMIVVGLLMGASAVMNVTSIDGEVATDEAILKNDPTVSMNDDQSRTLHVDGVVVPDRTEDLLGKRVDIPAQCGSFDLTLAQARELSAAMMASADSGFQKTGGRLVSQ